LFQKYHDQPVEQYFLLNFDFDYFQTQNLKENIVQQADHDISETKIQQIFKPNILQQPGHGFSEKEVQQNFIWKKTEQHESKSEFESSENINTHDLNEAMDENFTNNIKINSPKKKSRNKKQLYIPKRIETTNQERNPVRQLYQQLLNEQKQFVPAHSTESNEEEIKDEQKLKTE
jgi:hypothetical protein